MQEYYSKSRSQIAKFLNQYQIKTALEVGCGLGFVCHELSLKSSANIKGVDISIEAISRAKKKFPEYKFMVGDITSKNFFLESNLFQCVILNQLLWYVLEELPLTINNAIAMIEENGLLIVSNAFIENQNYGKDIIDGFSGAFDYFKQCTPKLKLIHAEFNDSKSRLMDGIFVLQKITK
jgi:SAM-dependent methyltransferase